MYGITTRLKYFVDYEFNEEDFILKKNKKLVSKYEFKKDFLSKYEQIFDINTSSRFLFNVKNKSVKAQWKEYQYQVMKKERVIEYEQDIKYKL